MTAHELFCCQRCGKPTAHAEGTPILDTMFVDDYLKLRNWFLMPSRPNPATHFTAGAARLAAMAFNESMTIMMDEWRGEKL